MTIEFETDMKNSQSGRLQPSAQNPKMIKFLIDKGIAKNETQAFYVLLGISIICFLLSVYIFWGYVIGFPVKAKPLTPEQQKARQEMQDRLQRSRENSQNLNTNNSQI